MNIRNVLKVLFVALIAIWSSGAMSAQTLVFAGFGGSFRQVMMQDIIPKFEKQHDVHVRYVTGTSNQILAKVRAQKGDPKIDVIWANDTTQYEGTQAGLFAPLDPDIVTNLSDLYDFAKYPGNIGVAMIIQAVVLQYNTKVFKEKGWKAPTSWHDLWDSKYKGHVVAYNMPIGYAQMFLVKAAELNGGDHENLEPGWNAIKQLKDNALAFVNPPAQVAQLFSSGSAWIAFNGSMRAATFHANGGPAAMVFPKEGALLYPQQFDVVKGAPHPKLAQQFVNFVLSPWAQEKLAYKLFGGPVNKKVKLAGDITKKVPYGPNLKSIEVPNLQYVNSHLDKLTHKWLALIQR